jgi:hypothetical protein
VAQHAPVRDHGAGLLPEVIWADNRYVSNVSGERVPILSDIVEEIVALALRVETVSLLSTNRHSYSLIGASARVVRDTFLGDSPSTSTMVGRLREDLRRAYLDEFEFADAIPRRGSLRRRVFHAARTCCFLDSATSNILVVLHHTGTGSESGQAYVNLARSHLGYATREWGYHG